jgi:hypothetical protein
MTDENREPEPTRPRREPGNAPEGGPGNDWLTPEAERPPGREEGVVSDPDQYATRPPALTAAPALPGAGRVSDPDF